MTQLKRLMAFSASLLFGLRLFAQPDLAPLALPEPNPLSGPPNPQITLVWGVTNQGTAMALNSWVDGVSLSTTPALDASSIPVIFTSDYGPLAPGGVLWHTNELLLPVTTNGTYYLIFQADTSNLVLEANETNNLLVVPLTFAAQPPDLAPFALQAPANLTAPPDPVVTLVWAVTNQGIGAAPDTSSWSDALYFSSNSVFDSSAVSLFVTYEGGPLQPGKVYRRTNSVQLPAVQSGNYYLFFQTDIADSLYESDTNNNMIGVPITLKITPSDLRPFILQVPTEVIGPPHPQVTLLWGVTNQGTGSAVGYWFDSVSLSANPGLDSSSLVVSDYPPSSLEPGTTYLNTNTVQLPVTESGTYYLIFQTGLNSSLYESNQTNNLVIVQLHFDPRPPDLAPLPQAPRALTTPPYPMLDLVWGVTNQGSGEALGYPQWDDQVYFSTNPVLDASALQLANSYQYGPLLPGGVYWQTNSVQLPGVSSGTYYLIFQTDLFDNLLETDTNNNVIVAPITLNITPADLRPLIFQAPSTVTGPPNPQLSLSWVVTNQGVGAALGSWLDLIFLSKSPSLDASSLQVASDYQSGPLMPGATYEQTNSVQLPVVDSGTYYLILQADSSNSLDESDTNNNTIVVPVIVNIRPPDLVPLVLQAPTAVTGPPYPEVTLVWGATNQGTGAALGNWGDAVYLSKTPALDASSLLVFNDYQSGPLTPGSTYFRTNVVRLPLTESGTYYLIFDVDNYYSVFELIDTNNLLAMPLTYNARPPDLAPVALQTLGNTTVPPFPIVTVVWGVTNQGNGDALGNPYWSDQLWLSTLPVLDVTATIVANLSESGPIVARGAYWRTNQVQLPIVTSGTYYLIFQADFLDPLLESDTNNNLIVASLALNITPPDLQPLISQAPTQVTGPPNPEVTLIWGVTNSGIGEAIGRPYWLDSVYISSNQAFDSSAVPVKQLSGNTPLAPGSVYWWTNQVQLPIVQSGKYYLMFATDLTSDFNYGITYDANPNNNLLVVPLTVNITPPDLAAYSFNAPQVVDGPPNPKVLFSWRVTNQGLGAAIGQWQDQVYLATNAMLDGTEVVLTTSFESQLAPGASYARRQSAEVPVVQSGNYYFIFETDTGNSLFETDTTNNTLTLPVTFHINPPDLVPVLLVVPKVELGAPNLTLSISYAVTNQGSGPALAGRYSGVWNDQLFISTNATLDGTETLVQSWTESGPVGPGQTYWRNRTVRVPISASGRYYFIFQANAQGTLYESNATNNVTSMPVTFNLQLPDLAPLVLQPARNFASAPHPGITLVWGITNEGSGDAIANQSWRDTVYLSTNSVIDSSAVDLFDLSETEPLAAGSALWSTNLVQLPITEAGTYYLLFMTDVYGEVVETTKTNNLLVVPLTFEPRAPDFTPVALQAPRNLATSPPSIATLVWGVTNGGTGDVTAGTYWYDSVFISTNSTFDSSATLVGEFFESGPLRSGAIYWQTNDVRLSVIRSGRYYVFLEADAGNYVFESNTNNNMISVPLDLQIDLPDLRPIAFEAPRTVVGPRILEVTLIWGVTNQGAGAVNTDWYDSIHLSTNTDLSGSFGLETPNPLTWFENSTLPARESYWRTNTVQMTIETNGTFYLIFSVNDPNYLTESDYTNNILATPVTFQIESPDLAPVAFQAPAVIAGPANPAVTLVWGVTNQGATYAAAPDGWFDVVYFSTNNVLDPTAVLIAQELETNAVPPEGSYWRTNSVRIPEVKNGNYYLFFDANAYPFVRESNYSNNVVSVPVTFTLEPPDLAPIAWVVPNRVTGGPWPTITVVAAVTNSSPWPAPGNVGWQDGIYLSTTPFLDQSSQLLTTLFRTETLPPGAAYWVTNTLQLPIVDSATWYLIYKTDAYDTIAEADEDNNTAIASVTLDLSPPADLVPLELVAPTLVTGPYNPTVTVAWRVANRGLGPAIGRWSDAIWLNTSYPLQPVSRVLIDNQFLASGADYWQTNTFVIPDILSGDYFFTLQPNFGENLFETDLDNNLLKVPVRFDVGRPAGPIIIGGYFGGFSLVAPLSFVLEVDGNLGSQYVLQGSTDLLHWINVTNFTLWNVPTLVPDEQALSFPQRFYRLVAPGIQSSSPALTISRTRANTVVVAWPLPADGNWVLEQRTTADRGAALWTQLPPPYQTNSAQAWVSTDLPKQNTLFRLRRR
jgi:subtilase family serine protease